MLRLNFDERLLSRCWQQQYPALGSSPVGTFAVSRIRTRGSMDGELRIQVHRKNHGVDQDSDWRPARKEFPLR